MKTRNLLPASARTICIAPGAQAGTTTGAIVDMSNFESIIFILAYASGLSAANTPVLSAKYGDNSALSDGVAVPNTSTAALGAAVTFQTLEITRITKRYVAPVVTCNGANEYFCVIAIAFNGKLDPLPSTQFSNSPTGTATAPLVPQPAAFDITTGEFQGGGFLQTPAVAAQEFATLLANA
jgi:hypothetical protein